MFIFAYSHFYQYGISDSGNFNIAMKKFYLSSFIAAVLLGLALSSCTKDAKAPTVTVTAGTATDHSLTFTVTPGNAAECAWMCMESGSAVPSAERILAEGNRTDASQPSTVETVGLDASTTYTIIAAAAGEGGTALSIPVEMATTEQRSHTLIVYMMGNNGLETFMDSNLSKIMGAADRIPDNGRIAVFYDRGNYTRLTELVKEEDGRIKQSLIEEYDPERTSSVDPDFMAEIIALVKEKMPAETYGLVMSSHGGGWVPSSVYDRYMLEMQGTRRAGFITRFFGQDGNDCMEIPDLVTALSGMHYEYILFDACFMASVEALYDLRNTADYIIASSAEVLGTGFPYQDIIPLLFRPDHGLRQSCEAFIDLYRKTSGTISLIDCNMLDALATSMKDMIAAADAVPDVSKIQAYEGFATHLYFDLEQYALALTSDTELQGAFLAALAAAVPYTDHSPTFFSAYGKAGTIDLPYSCGLTCHVEQVADPAIHEDFLETAWAKAIGAK